jgi:cysteinyl-tRNA synthetase
VHHTNEIAQSEAATGRKFFNWWMHGAFLIITGGKKMAKSEGNFLILDNVFVKAGINPLVYRFAAFQTHYRKPMEYSDESVQAARNGLLHLQNQVRQLAGAAADPDHLINPEHKSKFLEAVNDDLNMPRALAAVQELLKSNIGDDQKYTTILDFDRILGLDLDQVNKPQELPSEVKKLVDARQKAREDKEWEASDRLRDEIQALSYMVHDTPDGMKIIKRG